MEDQVSLEDQSNALSDRDKEKQRIQRYFQRFRKAQLGRANKEGIWKTLDTFDRSEQWDGVEAPPWIPKPITNIIRYIRTLKRANLSSAIPMCTFSPEYLEDIQDIQKLDNGYRHVWETEHVPRTIRRCIDRAVLQGTAIAYVYEDSSYVGGKYFNTNEEKKSKNHLFRGAIGVKRWALTNFFPDPDAYRLENCKWIETTEILPLSTIKNNPDFKKHAGTKLAQLGNKQTDNEDSADGTIFVRDTSPSNSSPAIKGDELVTLHCHYERYLNENSKWQLDITYYIKNTDFELLRLEDVKPNEYPFAILYDEEEEQDFFGTSQCMDIIENQKIISKVSQTASIIGMLNQNPQKVVSRESGINGSELARTGTLPGKVWTANGDPSKAIHHLEPPQIPKELFELKQDIIKDTKDMAGVTEAYTGESVGSLTTSTGVQDLIERATIRDKDKMIQIDEFIERISHLIMLFILHKWDQERPVSYTQPDGTVAFENFTPIDKETAENLTWRIKVDTYAKAPTTQASRRQAADKLMQMQGQFNYQPAIITPEEWIQMQDFDNKEQILARMKKDREVMQQQAQQQAAKIPANGEVKVSLSSSDPNVIMEYLQGAQENATISMQTQAQIQGTSGIPQLPSMVGSQGGQAPSAPNQSAPAQGTGEVAAANQARGGM